VVHPARGHATGTLVNGLLALGAFDRELPSEEMRVLEGELPESFSSEHLQTRGRDNELHLRPGIVHRLDKGTSGVMVVARTSAAREALKEQFAAHTIDREYVALCNGEVKSRTFATMHGRHPTDRLRFTSHVVGGKRAVTAVRTIETFGRGAASHVVCRLETGRTHQIRMHLAENATPVLGDPLYGKPPKNETVRQLAGALGHQALHARLLGFDHPRTGKRVRFEAPPPPDFELALETLRALPT
jgi:23S rRNA pseudouridine1911/1915/1917 synthase